MKVVVDLNRCQGYGQCVYAAPNIFQLKGPEILAYDPAPPEQWRDEVERAACLPGTCDQGRGRQPIGRSDLDRTRCSGPGRSVLCIAEPNRRRRSLVGRLVRCGDITGPGLSR